MKKHSLTLLIALLFSVLVAFPTLAQNGDLTVEPVATVEATTVVVVDVPAEPAPAPASNDSDVTLSVWQIITGIAGAFALGGVAGLAGFGLIATRLRNDPATMSAIEKLGNSVPETTAKLIIDLAKSAQAIAELAKEALDRVPAASKPAEPTAPTEAG